MLKFSFVDGGVWFKQEFLCAEGAMNEKVDVIVKDVSYGVYGTVEVDTIKKTCSRCRKVNYCNVPRIDTVEIINSDTQADIRTEDPLWDIICKRANKMLFTQMTKEEKTCFKCQERIAA